MVAEPGSAAAVPSGASASAGNEDDAAEVVHGAGVEEEQAEDTVDMTCEDAPNEPGAIEERVAHFERRMERDDGDIEDGGDQVV